MAARSRMGSLVLGGVALAVAAGTTSVSTASVTAQEKAGRLETSASVAAVGSKVTVAGKLPTRGVHRVVLQRKRGKSWSSIAARKSTRSGAFSFRTRLPGTGSAATYRVTAPGVRDPRSGRTRTLVTAKRSVEVAPAVPTTGTLTRITASNGNDSTPTISADGRFVAFYSDGTDLVPGNTANLGHVGYLIDLATGVVTKEGAGDGEWRESAAPALSADGRVLAGTGMTALPSNPGHGVAGVFVNDRADASASRVFAEAAYPQVSGDGRVVAFPSHSKTLDKTGEDRFSDVFAYDRATGAIEQLTDGDSESGSVSVSHNGRFVAFDSFADTIAPGGVANNWDVYLRDRVTDRTTVISAGAGMTSRWPMVSGDGQTVVYYATSKASPFRDIYVYDVATGVSTRVTAGNNHTQPAAISADGRFLAFASWATNLVPGDTNGRTDVFVHDRYSGKTSRITPNEGVRAGYDRPFLASISGDGSLVTFHSSDNGLVPGDVNSLSEIFVWRRSS